MQGHDAHGGYYGYDDQNQDAQEGGYDGYGAYHVQASQTHPYDHLQASSYDDWNQNQPCQVDLNGHGSYNRPWSNYDPPDQTYNYDRGHGYNQSWNYNREQGQNFSQNENILMAESQHGAENQRSGEFPDPGAQVENNEMLPPLSYCSSGDSDSDSDPESDNEFSPRHDSSSSSE